MRSRRFPARLGLMALSGLLATACATPSPPPGDAAAWIMVDNDTATINQATIYAVSDGGVRNRLGIVGIQSRKTFTIDNPIPGGEYQLVANAGNRVLQSRTFTLDRGETVVWDLKTNAVFYGPDQGSRSGTPGTAQRPG